MYFSEIRIILNDIEIMVSTEFKHYKTTKPLLQNPYLARSADFLITMLIALFVVLIASIIVIVDFVEVMTKSFDLSITVYGMKSEEFQQKFDEILKLPASEARTNYLNSVQHELMDTVQEFAPIEMAVYSVLIASVSVILILTVEILRFILEFQRPKVYPTFRSEITEQQLLVSMKHKSDCVIVMVLKEELLEKSGNKIKPILSQYRYLDERDIDNGNFHYPFVFTSKAGQSIRLTVYSFRISDYLAHTKKILFEGNVSVPSKKSLLEKWWLKILKTQS